MNEIYENFIFLEIINNVFDDEQQTQDQEKKDMEERNFSDYIKKNKTESNMDSYDIQDNNMTRFEKYNMNKKNEENKNKHYHHIITNTQYIDNNDSKDNSNIISQSINSDTNTHIHNKVHKWVQCDDLKPTNETDVYIDSNKNMNKYINIDHLNDHKKNYQ